jgi:hypothetical protein
MHFVEKKLPPRPGSGSDSPAGAGKSLYSGALPPTFKARANRQSRNRIEDADKSRDTMKIYWLFQIVMLAGTLSQPPVPAMTLFPFQSTAGQSIFAETSTAPTHAGTRRG